MNSYYTLIYETNDLQKIVVFVKNRTAWIDEYEMSKLFGISESYLKKILSDIIEKTEFEKQYKELKELNKLMVYSMKIVEEVGKVLKSRSGNLLNAFIKERIKPQEFTISNLFEALFCILEIFG